MNKKITNYIKNVFSKKSKAWAKAALIRAVKTFGQVAASGIAVGAALNEVNWKYLLSCAAVAFICSILTSLGGLPEAKEE